MEQTNIRKDAKGNIISKITKEEFHISFKEDFVEIIDVESYKEFNKLDETQLEDNDFHISRECKDCNCIII